MERDGIKALQGGERVVYVGDEEVQQGGVAFMMSVKAKRALMEWMQISTILLKTLKANGDTSICINKQCNG